jgi:hypothetical protein
VKRLFVSNSDYWSDISFDSAANQNKHKATMHLITYQAPDYVAKAMFDPNGMIKPYRVGYNKLVPFPPKIQSDVAPLSKGNTAISDQIKFIASQAHLPRATPSYGLLYNTNPKFQGSYH